jgi:ATP-dependent DNA helicase RecQ
LDRVLRRGDNFDVSPYDLSVACDMRATVVSTVMAYLETEGYIESTGTFYATYQIRFLSPVPKVLAGRPAAERKFLGRLLEAGEEKRWWFHFQPTELAEKLCVSREKIVSALSDLERAGDAALKVSGVRKAYRLKKDPGPLAEFSAGLSKVFEEREQADLGRLEQVLGLASRRGCLTGYLTSHFGEKLAEPCGHCDRCRGVPPKTVKRKAARRIKDDELAAIHGLVGERHAALSGTRQLARFLCGMTSPASIRARLTKHDSFGLLDDVPFADVLAMAETMIRG